MMHLPAMTTRQDSRYPLGRIGIFLILFSLVFLIPGCKLFEASSSARFLQKTDKLNKEGEVVARAFTEVNYDGAWIQGNRTVSMPLEDDPNSMNFGHPKAINVASSTDITPAERAQASAFQFWEKMSGSMFQLMQQATAMAVTGITKTPIQTGNAPPDAAAIAQPPAWAIELTKAISELKTEIGKAKTPTDK